MIRAEIMLNNQISESKIKKQTKKKKPHTPKKKSHNDMMRSENYILCSDVYTKLLKLLPLWQYSRR